MYCVHRVLYLAACFHGQRLLVQRPADVSRAQDVEADVGNDFNALALPPPSPPIWHEYCAACGQLSRPHHQQLLPCLMLLVSKACCEHCTSRVCAFSWDAADTGLLGAEDHCDGRLLARDVEPRYEALQCTTGQVWAGALNMLGPPVLNV